MIKAKRSLRIARIYTTQALKRLRRLPDMLADALEKHALRH
jgi:hypothetical protein